MAQARVKRTSGPKAQSVVRTGKPAAKPAGRPGKALSREPIEALRSRMLEIIRVLKRAYPDAECSLTHQSAFQLLVATILSAQCTDERVNKVTPALFARYPDAKALSKAKLADVEALIRTTGFFRSKALSITSTAKALVERHGGQVPKELDVLTQLRGVGRKTANVVLGNAYGIPGLVVDTHVGRLSRRMGFTGEADPVKVEHALMELVPRDDWTMLAHLFISHGRAVCIARRALCEECPVASLCPKVGV